MAGFKTDKRDLSRKLSARFRYNGVIQNIPSLDLLESKQETTSYRTSGPLDVATEDALNTKTSYNVFRENYPGRETDGTPWDTGHEFRTIRTFDRISELGYYSRDPVTGDWWSGPLALGNQGQSIAMPSLNPTPLNDVKYYGAKAIKMSTPTQPMANTAQMIGELITEGLPISGPAIMRITESMGLLSEKLRRQGFASRRLDKVPNWKDYLTSVGDGVLFLEFFAEPVIRDLVSIMLAVSSAGRRIEQWKRDSGKQIRRSRFVHEENTTMTGAITGQPFLAGLLFSNSPRIFRTGQTEWQLTRTQTLHKRIWFSGAYMYHASVGETILERIVEYGRQADLILGMKPDIQTLWELAPWSWLVDWKVNVGDALANANRFSVDNLVLKYGYLMVQTTINHTYTLQNVIFKDRNPGPLYRIRSVVQKERFKATPYGFGLNPETFSSGQWAILTALGLTKGGRMLP